MPNTEPSGAMMGVATRSTGTFGVSTSPCSRLSSSDEIKRGAGRQRDRLAEIFGVALPLQFGIRNDARRAVLARAIDPHDLATAVFDADDAELVIGRLEGELGGKSRRHAAAPDRFAGAVVGMNAAVAARANDAVERGRGGKAQRVGARDTRSACDLGGERPGMDFEPLHRARHRDRLERQARPP